MVKLNYYNNMKTLNQIKHILINYFESHAQIQQVVYSDDFDFNSNRNLIYPVVNIEYVNTNITTKTSNHIFKIVIADKVEVEDSNMEDNVHSDAIQIAEDFISHLERTEGWFLAGTSTINKFTDDTGDRTSGIVFTITLSVVRDKNRCNTPLKNT